MISFHCLVEAHAIKLCTGKNRSIDRLHGRLCKRQSPYIMVGIRFSHPESAGLAYREHEIVFRKIEHFLSQSELRMIDVLKERETSLAIRKISVQKMQT